MSNLNENFYLRWFTDDGDEDKTERTPKPIINMPAGESKDQWGFTGHVPAAIINIPHVYVKIGGDDDTESSSA